MTQNKAILAALKAGKHLTNDSAYEVCGTRRLPARIKELRDMGYQIGDVWRDGTSRFGRQMHYKEYFLIERRQEE